MPPQKSRKLQRPGRFAQCRDGAAVVEFVACLPVMVLLLFASIEGCNMVFLKQGLTSAAYETARVGIHPRATSAMATARGNEVLVARGVQASTITITPADVSTVTRGQPFTVTVTAPCSANANSPEWFFGGRLLSSSITMIKE